jgi:hypothetical protein
VAQTKERTFSFRAGADLDDRLQEAVRRFAASDRRRSGEFGRAFEHYLLDHLSELDPKPSDSALLRAMLESWIAASDRVLEDEALVDAYREWSTEDDDGAAFRDGAVRAGAEIWNE